LPRAPTRARFLVLARDRRVGEGYRPDRSGDAQYFDTLRLGRHWPVSAVKLVDGLAGESPASARFPVGAVVISGDGAGDQTVGSPEVNVLVGWV
jgi:hypothetical protein